MLKKYLPILVIAVLTYFVTNINYHFGDENHLEQLPFILSRLDNSYLRNDAFVEYTRQIGPRYYYAELLSQITPIISAQHLFYTLTYLSNFFIYLITYLFLRLLTKNNFIVFPLIILMGYSQFGSLGQTGYINDNYLTPQLLAMPLVLGAYYFSIKNKYLPSLLFSLLSIPIQPSLALVTSIPIVGNFLLHSRSKNQMIKILLYVSMLVVTTFLLFIRHSQKILSNDTYLYILAHLRHPHHYLPSRFASTDYLLFTIMLVTLMIGLVYFYNKKHSKIIVRHLTFTVILSLLLCLSAYIFAEIYPVRQIIEVQPFRIIYLVRWLAITVGFIAFCEFLYTKIPKTAFILFLILFVTSLVLFWPNKTMTLAPSLDTKFEPERSGLYKFISGNTDSSALFLTPPDFGSMRTVPRRAIVVDWKSFPFNEPSMIIWYDKVNAIYGLMDQDQNYRALSDIKIDQLQAKYHFDYVVLYSDTPTTKQVIYQDSHYKLVKTN